MLRAYMHTCIHACVHTCIHACMHTCMHSYMHTCIRAYVHTCICAYVPSCMHTRIGAYIHACMSARMHTCIQTHRAAPRAGLPGEPCISSAMNPHNQGSGNKRFREVLPYLGSMHPVNVRTCLTGIVSWDADRAHSQFTEVQYESSK